MRILVACEFSGIVRDAFAARGHDAWSCDLLSTERPGNHYQMDAEKAICQRSWDLLIAHPPCTYLTNAGAKHLYIDGRLSRGKNDSRWESMWDGVTFFNAMLNASVGRICVENPIMHKHARVLLDAPYRQIIQPWQFGHGETKATCLWLKNLPQLQPTDIVSGRVPRVHHESPGPDRWKNRSRTMQGLANAMALQWGCL